ncbi:TlpA family protein disulfide reductase [Mucilaginibacter angelicae]|uniref:TlpA family protein disulfide reductase n=1 Tax=Mucilaginibacter angelicae TaxID=869718 RepID=A0ABV6L4C6_9SPHI
MNLTIKTLIKISICTVFALLYNINVNAQATLVQKTIDKIKSYKNLSYQHLSKVKESFTNDTLTRQSKNFILKAPDDKTLGYLYRTETLNKAGNSVSTEFYNGKNLIRINQADSTYLIDEINGKAVMGLLTDLNWIKDFAVKQSSKMVIANDTIINAITCSHLIINYRDTIINNEHLYTRFHLFIDKVSDMPVYLIRNVRSADIGNAVTNYYSKDSYFDYKFDQNDISVADWVIPNGFHEKIDEPEIPLLPVGSIAPDFVLDGVDGKKITLSKLRGKVVLLDYFFVGCYPCMLSLKPLNSIHEKYKNQNVAIVSLTERDNEKVVAEFRKNYNIKYPIYVNGRDAVKSYHVRGFPTFYFIDKEGKIANVFVGYGDDFEEKVTSVIDKLLK